MLFPDNSIAGLRDRPIPTVSIGMPVYNAEATVGIAIESILSQSYTDFELIISDNASTDSTESICRQYQSLDRRVRFIRQEKNLGAGKNFEFVLSHASGYYFMWAAADDLRTSDFIKNTVQILESNPACVFASTPNCFQGEETQTSMRKNFELRGNLYQRITGFLDICWHSHGCFYSMIRKDALVGIPYMAAKFLAADWAVIVCLLTKGEFRRTSAGLQVLGGAGSSMQPNYLRKMSQTLIEFIAPLYYFSNVVFRIGIKHKDLTVMQVIEIFIKLLLLNITTAVMMYREEIVGFVKTRIAKYKIFT